VHQQIKNIDRSNQGAMQQQSQLLEKVWLRDEWSQAERKRRDNKHGIGDTFQEIQYWDSTYSS